MPPLSSSKFLCILAVASCFPGLGGQLLSIADPALIYIDVRRAHFVSWARRDIAVELPEGLTKPGQDLVGYLEKALYDTRDAAACWAAQVVRVVVIVRVGSRRAKRILATLSMPRTISELQVMATM